MKDFVYNVIENFIRGYEENSVIKWGDPIVGFADAKKTTEYVTGLMADHGKPEDAVSDASVIIAYYIPFAEEVAKTNEGGEMASEEWALAYEETNQMISAINTFLSMQLMMKGYKAVVHPAASSFDRDNLVSNWSHRHIAYMAGLGTFGVNNMLITEKGCCGRFGTIVTNLDVEADAPRTDELCLNKKDGSCNACIEACPAKALSQEGFDRKKCYEVCMKNAAVYTQFGSSYVAPGQPAVGSEVCGKCVTGMPCDFL